LSAHNDIHGEIFRDLDQMEEGDLVILFSARQSYTYVVQDVLVVEPSQVEYLESSGKPTATLISCYPYMVDNKRIIVIANLIDG
jgi:sortase A